MKLVFGSVFNFDTLFYFRIVFNKYWKNIDYSITGIKKKTILENKYECVS